MKTTRMLEGYVITPAKKSLQFQTENYALDLLEFCEGFVTSSRAQQFFRLRHHTLNLTEQFLIIEKAKAMQQ
jgi:hypothetical protein